MSVERNIKRKMSDKEDESSKEKKGSLLSKYTVIWVVFIVCAVILLIVLVVYNKPVKLLSDLDPKEISVIEVTDVQNKNDVKIMDSGHIEHIIKDISSFKYKRNGFSSDDTKAVFKLVFKNKKGTEVASLALISPEEVSSGMFNYKTEISEEVLPIAYIWGLSLRGTDITSSEDNA